MTPAPLQSVSLCALLLTGLSYDSSALRSRDRTPALPIDEQWRWGVGGTYDWSENTTLGFGFQYTNLGDANIDSAALKGDYKNNEIFFFMLNLNFAKLPWDGMARHAPHSLSPSYRSAPPPAGCACARPLKGARRD